MPEIKNKKQKRNLILKYLLVIILIIIVLEVALFFLEKNRGGEDVLRENTDLSLSESAVNMYLPAVDSEGKGVSTLLSVDVVEGEGRTLVDIDSLLFWADTQHSIRIAKLVAENVTEKKLKNYDLVYSVKANASVIGGPSAGAALAVATIAVLENKKLNPEIMITGTINHDGSIGPVSDIYAKAEAAKAQGVKTFIVPLLQSRDVIYETEKHCEKFGFSEVCTQETKPRKVNVSEEIGINIVEVGDVKEAMGYFFSS